MKHDAVRSGPSGEAGVRTFWLTVAWVVGHAAMALAMMSFRGLSTWHALATIAVAMGVALLGRVDRVLYVAMYVTGMDVLWRMASAGVAWELGKYLTALMLVVAGLRLARAPRVALPAYFYFVLLLPSLLLTFSSLSGNTARVQATFYLTGPFALAVAVWYFSKVTLSAEQLRTAALAAIGPIVGIASVAAYRTITAAELRFGGGSNFVTSGGFGPNQVSSALGLGALLAFLVLLVTRVPLGLRILLLGAISLLSTQGMLTFSRGGMIGAAIPAVLAALYLSRDSGVRLRVVGSFAVLAAVLVFAVIPRLDALTEGGLTERFSDANTTHRATFAQLDLEVWLENPVFGVGPGMGKAERAEIGFEEFASHTEYTRLLAEHGLFGLAAILILVGVGGRRLVQARTPRERAVALTLMAWTALYLAHAGMRTVAPSLLFGLAMARFDLEPARPARPRHPARWSGGARPAVAGEVPWRG